MSREKRINDKISMPKLSENPQHFFELLNEQKRYFEEEVYYKKNRKEKIHYWADYLRKSVRSYVEYGFDLKSCFTNEKYNNIKILEPNFDDILVEILETANLEVSNETIYHGFGIQK